MKSTAFNLGNGNGFSVREVIKVAEAITGTAVRIIEKPRREGDPARLVADASVAKKILGWSPQYFQLEKIVAHAWRWEEKRLPVTSDRLITADAGK